MGSRFIEHSFIFIFSFNSPIILLWVAVVFYFTLIVDIVLCTMGRNSLKPNFIIVLVNLIINNLIMCLFIFLAKNYFNIFILKLFEVFNLYLLLCVLMYVSKS